MNAGSGSMFPRANSSKCAAGLQVPDGLARRQHACLEALARKQYQMLADVSEGLEKWDCAGNDLQVLASRAGGEGDGIDRARMI